MRGRGRYGVCVSLLLIAALGYEPVVGMTGASIQRPSFCRETETKAVRAGVIGNAIHGISAALNVKYIAPGQPLYARLLNRGKVRASYGPPHRIERYVDSHWIDDPAGPHGPWTKVLWLLFPERAGRCFRYVVPLEQAEGIYRFVIPAKTDSGRSGRTVVFQVK